MKKEVPSIRFHRKYKKLPSGCWEWSAYKNKKGYGIFSNSDDPRYTMVLAHRFAWEQANGSLVPEGMYICHTCDNPPCVNPDYLWVGTSADNARDREVKGRRRAVGEKNGSTKLTEDDVRALRMLYAMGDTSFVKLGKQFGVGRTTVEHIVKHRKWAHVD